MWGWSGASVRLWGPPTTPTYLEPPFNQSTNVKPTTQRTGEEGEELLEGGRARLLLEYDVPHEVQFAVEGEPVAREQPPLVGDDAFRRGVDLCTGCLGVGEPRRPISAPAPNPNPSPPPLRQDPKPRTGWKTSSSTSALLELLTRRATGCVECFPSWPPPRPPPNGAITLSSCLGLCRVCVAARSRRARASFESRRYVLAPARSPKAPSAGPRQMRRACRSIGMCIKPV